MIHVPEQWLNGVLLRADFRAFYAIEREWKKPLGTILADALSEGLTGLYRQAWLLTLSDRPAGLAYPAFLDLLPTVEELCEVVYGLIDEAITPTCPVHPADSSEDPDFVCWSRLAFEGRHILGQTEAEWWRSTFRTQQALLWEYARHNDPDGKGGRPMAQWEIDAINQATMDALRTMRMSSD